VTSVAPLPTAQVKKILGHQFPRLPIQHIGYIAEGGDSHTYSINNNLIFRFPASAESAIRLQHELNLLPKLPPDLPVPLPDIQFVGQPDEAHPYLFLGQTKLHGLSGEKFRPFPAAWPAIAHQMGRLLSIVHAIPHNVAIACQLQHEAITSGQEHLAQVVQLAPLLEQHVPEHLTQPIRHILAGKIDIPPVSPLATVVCHADIKGEHFLLSLEGQWLTGLLDWGDVCLTDPLPDFSGLMIWLGEAFTRQVLEHYTLPVDEAFMERVCFYARCRTLINIGERLLGQTEAPLGLLLRQMQWAFSTYGLEEM
jgi:aminoglycoside 2''-phosphotransferase